MKFYLKHDIGTLSLRIIPLSTSAHYSLPPTQPITANTANIKCSPTAECIKYLLDADLAGLSAPRVLAPVVTLAMLAPIVMLAVLAPVVMLAVVDALVKVGIGDGLGLGHGGGGGSGEGRDGGEDGEPDELHDCGSFGCGMKRDGRIVCRFGLLVSFV